MLKITVNNQSLSLSEEVIAENSAEFAAFSVSFSSEWDGYEKTVRFRHADSKTVYDAAGVTDGGEYFIPAEVLHRGRVYVTCIGVKGSHSIATSTRESFEVKGALISGEGTVPTVTPNAYAQYVEMVKNRSQEVNDAADRAQQYANEAEDARVNTLMNSAAAAKSASVAKNAQNRAEDFASAAALSEVSAKASLDMTLRYADDFDQKCEQKKAELDAYTELKKSGIDEYAQKTYLEVEDYADGLKKDFAADANMLITNFDVHYASKLDLLSQKADEYETQSAQHSENAKSYAQEASDSAFSASVCKNQTLNALSSTLKSEQKASEYADHAAASAEIAAEKAAEAHNVIAGVFPMKDSFYTKEQADRRFSSAFYTYRKGDGLHLEDSDGETEFESFTVYGNTVRSHIPSTNNPCEITSFDGSIIFCGENVLDPDKCEFINITRENGVMTANLEEGETAAVNMESLIPFLRAGVTYTLTVKSDTVSENEKTVVHLGNAEFSADAACGFVTFTVPHTWDMSAFSVSLSHFKNTAEATKRTRVFSCLGLNRGILPSYTPYEGYTLAVGSPMRGIMVYNGKNGNPASKICDTLEYKNGELKLISRIGKTVLTGNSSEIWSYLTAREQPNTLNFSCRINGKGNYPVICDRLDYRGAVSSKTYEQIATNGQAGQIFIQIAKSTIGWVQGYTRDQNVAAMREWLSNNNLTVYYVLEKPVEKIISTNLLFPYKNIYCDFSGVVMEAEYKSERRKPSPCVVSNTVCGETVKLDAASPGMPIQKTEIRGRSVQEKPSPDDPKEIEGFGSVVIAYKGTNLTNSQMYTAKNALCTGGIIKVTLPAGESHAELYDETLNYTLEGGKTYNLCAECDTEPAQGEKIGININGTAFYSEDGSRSLTFTVPDGVTENSVSIHLCHFDTPVTEPVTRIFGALRVTEGESPMPYEPYKGSLVFMKSEIETDHGTADAVLRSCGDEYDRISICDNVGILEKRIGTLTAEGEENVSFSKDLTGGTVVEFILYPENYKKGNIYCTHLCVLNENEIQAQEAEGVYSMENGIAVRILASRLDGYSAEMDISEKCTLFLDWLWYDAPIFQYVLKNPEMYDISQSGLFKGINGLRTVEGGKISSIFDTGAQTPSFGTVQGDISVTYPCEIAEFVNFKIAEAVKATL